MNSSSVDNFLGMPSALSVQNFCSPILIVVIILLIVVCATVIAFLIKSGRNYRKFRRLLFHFAMNANHASDTIIDSPDHKGHFERPIWCTVCNDYVDHVSNLCPHVGRKFYFSILHRRLFEYWRRQVQQHYQSADIDSTKGKAVSNCTIDLNDLIVDGKGIERKVSRVSIILNSPRDTSTPNGGDRTDQRLGLRRQDTGLGRIRKILRSLSGRRLSIDSSGMGSSICSGNGKESLVQELKL